MAVVPLWPMAALGNLRVRTSACCRGTLQSGQTATGPWRAHRAEGSGFTCERECILGEHLTCAEVDVAARQRGEGVRSGSIPFSVANRL